MKYIIAILFLLICQQSWSQTFQFGLKWGVGSYSMEGLKGINDQIGPNMPFDTKLVSDFPAYYYYSPTVQMVMGDYTIGLVNTFQSTGSRISAKDYSGEYRFDMKVKSFSPGIYNELNILSINKVQFSGYAVIGCSFSKLVINENLTVVDTTLTDYTIKFESLNFYAEPGLNITYPHKSFRLGLNAGYNVTFGKQAFYTDNNKDLILSDFITHEPITPQWSGFRLGISLLYVLEKK